MGTEEREPAAAPPDAAAGLVYDRRNANLGTDRGRALLAASLRDHGAGRSILADKHGQIIAGNKTLAASADLGLPVRIVESDGSELIVVKRTDLDLDSATDRGARELAYLDNRVAELDLSWDSDTLLADQADGLDLAAIGFDDADLAALLGQPLPDFDAAAEWQGMPEYAHDDLQPVKQIVVSFAHADDVARFARLVEQNVTMGTKSIWYPAAEIGHYKDTAYVEAGRGDGA